MCNPPEMFEETLREITDTVQDIRDEAAFRDSERLHRVEATMKQNQARLEASQKQVQGGCYSQQAFRKMLTKTLRCAASCPARVLAREDPTKLSVCHSRDERVPKTARCNV